MKVKYKDTTEYKILKYIQKTKNDVILREDLMSLDNDRQITRALNALIKKGKITKIGYGIFVRLCYSELTGKTYLPKGFVSIAREALTRLGIRWDISEAERAYNSGKSQQVPANPATKLLDRFRRKISYKGMELRFE
ncbi:hypothetical protein L3V79_09280 [Thiotrichales bacterium 19S9-12]|nr:hypothetical protein [Thiotrichales bacterium 19S9-11]MCF6812550.1 hypothetical protein [Thiotrichales bacterium 19S9-12]